MIRNSFILLSGVGEQTEHRLWRAGLHAWDDYRNASAEQLPARVRRHHERHTRHLDLAERCLKEGRTGPFGRWLPSNETWRLWEEAQDRALYLDIETTGLQYPQGRTTVVGMHGKGRGTELLVRGRDLTARAVQDALDESALLVTFNGRRFDVPFLEREFGIDASGVAHLDLMQAFHKAGIKGGLKRIEVALGLSRSDELQGVDGYEAVRLWKRYERGQRDALETLLAYNEADVVNMVPLARIAFERLLDETFGVHAKAAADRTPGSGRDGSAPGTGAATDGTVSAPDPRTGCFGHPPPKGSRSLRAFDLRG